MNIISKIFHKNNGIICPKCNSHNTTTILIWSYDENHRHNAYDMRCNNCGYEYTIKER